MKGKWVWFAVFSCCLMGCSLFDELVSPSDITQIINRNNDTIAPKIKIISPEEFQKVSPDCSVICEAIDQESGIKSVYVSCDNILWRKAISLQNNLWFSDLFFSASGTNIIYAYAEDNRGNNSGTNKVSVLVFPKPVVNVAFPEYGMVNNMLPMTVKGSVIVALPDLIDAIWISVNGAEKVLLATNVNKYTTNWSYTISNLSAGLNNIVVTAISVKGIMGSSWTISFFQSTALMTKFVPLDGAAGDQFGSVVSSSPNGNAFIIGVREDDDKGLSSGSAYLFKWNGTGWITNKFVAYDGVTNDFFGSSVSVASNGNSVLVGAWGDDDLGTDSGAVYLFEWIGSQWKTNKITSPDGTVGDAFGWSVCFSQDGKTFAVGAPGDSEKGDSSGSVYLYQWNGTTWVMTNKFWAYDGQAYVYFGNALAMSENGESILVGAYYDNSYAGSAYLMKWTGSYWTTNKFTPLTGDANDEYGHSVSLSADGNDVLIGAWGDDDAANSSGAAYFYRWNGSAWSSEMKFIPPDGIDEEAFGYSLSLSSDGNKIAVGAYNDDENGECSGSVYLYEWNDSSWELNKLAPVDGTNGMSFGISVSLSGDGLSIVSGAIGDDAMGENSGVVYLIK